MKYIKAVLFLLLLSCPVAGIAQTCEDDSWELFLRTDDVAVSVPGGVVVLKNLIWKKYRHYDSPFPPHLSGEIVNDSENNWEHLILEITLFDRSGKKIAPRFPSDNPTQVEVLNLSKGSKAFLSPYRKDCYLGIGVSEARSDFQKVAISFLWGLPLRTKFNHDVKFERSYDRYKGETTIKMDYLPLVVNRGNVHLLALNAVYSYFDKDFLNIDPKAIVTFSYATQQKAKGSAGNNWDLILLADHSRIVLGKPDYYLSQDGNERGLTYEHMGFDIQGSTLTKIAYSQKVEGRIGAIEFEFTETQLEALRDLANRVRHLAQ